MHRRLVLAGAVVALTGCSPSTVETVHWSALERHSLRHHVQLTFASQFHKAGESYFSPDDSRVIFQAVPTPPPGAAPDEFYGMYVGDVVRDEAGRVCALERIVRISPEGSANTCGWFHPTEPGVVIFASTVTPPVEPDVPGYQRSGRYKWAFPPEMDIMQLRLADAGTPDAMQALVSNRQAYMAECSISPDGRHLLYCSLESGAGDLLVRDGRSGLTTAIVEAPGYDGGPFFSPEGRRICYRSDRRSDNLLQLFVADLAFDAGGAISGIEREYQLTDDGHVNWCPFWHPSGRFLVYSTSRVGHSNYEVFMLDADDGQQEGSSGTIRNGTRIRRVTHAPAADVLPAFSHDGRSMIWTSKRGPAQTSQLWVADFVVDLDAAPAHTSGLSRGH